MIGPVRVTVKDTGFNRAVALLKQPRKILSVGVHETEAAHPYPGKPGVTVGLVAVVNEYGSDDGHVPARSWLRDPVDQNADEIAKRLIAATMRVLFGKPPESEENALAIIGTWFRRLMVDRIRYENVLLGNAPATVKKKGFDLPLIDHELLIESMRWEVR